MTVKGAIKMLQLANKVRVEKNLFQFENATLCIQLNVIPRAITLYTLFFRYILVSEI